MVFTGFNVPRPRSRELRAGTSGWAPEALIKSALNNSDYRSHEEQIEAILRYLDWRNRKRGISLADWVEYKRQQAIPA